MLVRRESLRSSRKRLLIFRGLAGFGGVSCLFYGVRHLPLSVAAMINWSSPIFVILFSWLFIRERLPRKAGLWIFLAFIGLVLLLRPDLKTGDTELSLAGMGVSVLGAAFAGLAYVAVRAATAEVGVNAIVFYFTATATLISAPLAASDFTIPDSRHLIELLLLGIFATIGQLTMTQAYRFASAGVVSTMNLLNAAFSAILGWWLFGETLAALQWLGMSVLAFSLAAITLSSAQSQRQST